MAPVGLPLWVRSMLPTGKPRPGTQEGSGLGTAHCSDSQRESVGKKQLYPEEDGQWMDGRMVGWKDQNGI